MSVTDDFIFDVQSSDGKISEYFILEILPYMDDILSSVKFIDDLSKLIEFNFEISEANPPIQFGKVGIVGGFIDDIFID